MATAQDVHPARPADLDRPLNRFPRLEACSSCGKTMLLARHGRDGVQGRPFRLELPEVFPIGPCGRCSGRGCGWCKDTGERGEEIPGDAVIFNLATGHARRYDGERGRWDAVHRRHRCEEHVELEDEGPTLARRQRLYLERQAVSK